MSAARAIADAPDTPVVLRLAPGPGRRWQDEALCAQVDPDLWFPEKGESSRRARQVCRSCPVATECLDYALGAGERLYGVWGGLSEQERRRLRRAAS